MDLIYQLFTPTDHWSPDITSLAAAISSQGSFRPGVEIEGSRLLVREATHGLVCMARLLPYTTQSYEALRDSDTYQVRMTPRDRDTALPFQRTVEILTGNNIPDAEMQALFHATVSDGIWWLMGGFLIDSYRRTIWGWRAWRTEQPLAAHATETVAQLTAIQGGTR